MSCHGLKADSDNDKYNLAWFSPVIETEKYEFPNHNIQAKVLLCIEPRTE